MCGNCNKRIFQKLHRLSLLIGALTILLPLIFWNKIPDRLPMHYNGAGQVDNWSDKTSLILLFFVIALLMGVMSIAVYMMKTNMESKHSKEAEKSEVRAVYPVLVIMNLIVQIMFAYIMVCAVNCRPLGVWFLPVFLFGIFVPIGFMIYKSARARAVNAKKESYANNETEEHAVLYRSAVDLWLVLVIVGCEALVIWTAIDAAIEKGAIDWTTLLVAIGCSAIFIPLFDIKYVMYEEHLLVSMSIFGKTRIAYKDIVDVKKSCNPLSSPAMSLKRVQIDYIENGVHRMTLISPKNREIFMKEIEDRRERRL